MKDLKPDEIRHLIFLAAKGPEKLFHTDKPFAARRRITHSAVIERKLRRLLGKTESETESWAQP